MSLSDLSARLQAALGDAYRIERELGGGGMSRVFLAEERSLHSQVVVKCLPPEFAIEALAERFRREIELAAHLQHPNILPVLAAGSRDDLLYYVIPYVRNADPELQPLVQEAKAGLQRLSGERKQ